MTTVKKIAVIGLGNIGKAVAENLNKAGRTILVAGRDTNAVKEIAKDWQNATVTDIATAVKEADIVIPTIYFNVLPDFFTQYAAELQGKILVDVSNPIAADENGGFKKIIGEKESAGQILAAQLPKGVHFAKALGTLGVASLVGEAFATPRKVLFYATDEASINPEVEQLLRDTGFEPLRVGGIDQSIRIEVFGDLHEFGALGKTVTLEEAKSKL
ncbi:MAG: NAD(P)-binding domain-containing protein [Capnocytophaga sp.]|nr:NAD(P)-binding domain-containing protein [Capnocytophaga sp.]